MVESPEKKQREESVKGSKIGALETIGLYATTIIVGIVNSLFHLCGIPHNDMIFYAYVSALYVSTTSKVNAWFRRIGLGTRDIPTVQTKKRE